MNTHDVDIELPPLPDLPAYSSEVFDREVKVVSETMAEQLMHDYARAAIEPYQQRVAELESQLEAIGAGGVSSQRITSPSRGEAVAWQWLDTAHFRKQIPSHSNAEEWRPLFTAPPPAEPVKAPSSFPTGTEYSVEPHGNGYAIYQGRDQFHHGLNLAHLTECAPEFSKRIESALNAMHEPEGWKLVPVELTHIMMYAGVAEWLTRDDPEEDVQGIWEAMLSAAPKFGEEE